MKRSRPRAPNRITDQTGIKNPSDIVGYRQVLDCHCFAAFRFGSGTFFAKIFSIDDLNPVYRQNFGISFGDKSEHVISNKKDGTCLEMHVF